MIHDLTGCQRDLLFAISGLDRPNGQEIKQEIADTQGRTIRRGQLYKSLDRLVEYELVVKRNRNGRTNEYDLTPKGETAVRMIHEWQEFYLGRRDSRPPVGRS